MGTYWPTLRRFDALTLGYLAIVGTIVTMYRSRVPDWSLILAGFAAAGLLIVALVAAYERWPSSRTAAFFRWSYPLFFSIVLYDLTGTYSLVLRGHFLDAGMNAWELAVFGGHPNVVIDRLATPPLTELLYLCYFGFYLLFLIPPIMLWLARRYRDLERYVFALMCALYVCYLGFLVVPLLGPDSSLAGRFHPQTLTGYVVVPLQDFIMAKGDPIGACFPSAHVAGAWTALLAIRAIWGRSAFRRLLPFTVGLTVAVVYTRYHYLSDALAGLAVAAVVFPLVARQGWRAVDRAPVEILEPVDSGPLAA